MTDELRRFTRLLTDAVTELNISRKNVCMYPPGHVQITRSIERAYEILQRLFQIRSEINLAAAKDALMLGEDYLDKKNIVCREFALSLTQQGIAAVTFWSGLTKDELIRFHRVLTMNPADIRTMGGIEKVISGSSTPHVRIIGINYDSFKATEEQEIIKSQSKSAPDDIWRDFVAFLSSGNPDARNSRTDAERFDPAELSRLLNEHKLDSGAAIRGYDRILTAHIRNAEEGRLTQDQSKALEDLNTMLKGLDPGLRKQFLSVAFQRLASVRSADGINEMIRGFPDEMMVEMLGQAHAEGSKVSPTLAALMRKLTRSRAGAADNGQNQTEDASPETLPENIQNLFDRQKYEDYMSSDYGAMLKQMAETSAAAGGSFAVEKYQKTLDDAHLGSQIGRALISLLDEDLEEEDYRDLSRKLSGLLTDFLEVGKFELLLDISETLRRHAVEKPVKSIREAAQEASRMFSDPSFIKKAVKAFEVWVREKGQAAADLIQALGHSTIPGLLDIFSKDESHGGKRILFDLLCLFGEPAVREARKRLRDPRPYFVINLLIFIRRAGTPDSIPSIRPLLGHPDPIVRMEALSTLLKFKAPEAVKLLREWIRSDDPDAASQAVSLAALYRVAEVTGDILARIKRVILFDTDYTVNVEIIKALGAIGDPRAIPDLEKLARANWTFHPTSLKWMKELLFESLSRYPRESIDNLIKIGEHMNNDKIRRACSKLAQGGK